MRSGAVAGGGRGDGRVARAPARDRRAEGRHDRIEQIGLLDRLGQLRREIVRAPRADGRAARRRT